MASRRAAATLASAKLKRGRSESPPLAETKPLSRETESSILHVPASPQKTKKLKLLSSYVLTSPFPDFGHPTMSEAYEVYDILCKHHNRVPARKAHSPNMSNSNSAQTCGNVANVIDALIGTILSQNTSGKNSSAAKASLDKRFGKENFEAIASAPRNEVVEAIKHGGLANKKAGVIQKVLESIKAKHGVYSLQHLASPSVTDEEVMEELVSYDGVGPKTASCVLLFCLGRDSFAVDTHVYRLSKVLGWVPAKADRVLTQAHLDVRIPAELKYGLHVLMIQHGRACKGCKGVKVESGEGCVLKRWVRERRGMDGEGRPDPVKGEDDESSAMAGESAIEEEILSKTVESPAVGRGLKQIKKE